MPDIDPDVLLAAWDYAEQGWPVFPVKVTKNRKLPLLKGWPENATTDGNEVQRLWSKWPRAGVGIVTGRRSGLVVIDVDGPEGEKSLRRLEEQHGRLPATLTNRTPSGGRHLVFSHPGGLRTSASALAPKVDVRGEGGLFVAPPTRKARGAYRWAEEDAEPAPLPGKWVAALQRASGGQESAPTDGGTRRITVAPDTYAEQVLAEELADLRELKGSSGERNNRLNIAAGNLGRFVGGGYLDEEEVRGALVDVAYEIGLRDDEVPATVNSGLQHGLSRPLTLVSSKDRKKDTRGTDAGVVASWVDDVDLEPWLTGDVQVPTPELWEREDGLVCLLYRGKTHVLAGDGESLKTWMALHACAERIKNREHVWFLDFEDDAGHAVVCLLAAGSDPDDVRQFFHYRNPRGYSQEAVDAFLIRISQEQAAIVVIDAVIDAMAANDWDPDKNMQITKFYNNVTDPIKRTGAAVVLIDHVTKQPGQRGPTGGAHKYNGVDVVYKIDSIIKGGIGEDSLSGVWCEKDRSAQIRPAGIGQGKVKLVALFELSGIDDRKVELSLQVPHFDWKKQRVAEGLTENEHRVLGLFPLTDKTLTTTEVKEKVNLGGGKPMMENTFKSVIRRLKARGYLEEVEVGKGRKPSVFRRVVVLEDDPEPDEGA